MNMERVPVVDLAMLNGRSEDSVLCIDRLGSALHDIGFVVLVNHGISKATLDDVYAATQRVFSYPDPILSRYETPWNDRQTGFTPFKKENAKGEKLKDLKRFWHIRREPSSAQFFLQDRSIVRNVWPAEVPEFRPVMLKLFEKLDKLALDLLALLDEYLALDSQETLPGMVRNGQTLLRVLHYPPLRVGDEGVRAAAHEDINFITLLLAATASGLEVRTRDGEWIAVNETPGSIVLNVGDMLQKLTKERLRSTTHRVVNPPQAANTDRFSVPFFVHPRGEVVLDKASGFTAQEYLKERLKEIGLMEK